MSAVVDALVPGEHLGQLQVPGLAEELRDRGVPALVHPEMRQAWAVTWSPAAVRGRCSAPLDVTQP
jgi:hypothetical protein